MVHKSLGTPALDSLADRGKTMEKEKLHLPVTLCASLKTHFPQIRSVAS